MPLNYLHQLEHAALPLTVTEAEAVRAVELLHASLLVNAMLRRSSPDSKPHAAVVFEITPSGYGMLQRIRQQK